MRLHSVLLKESFEKLVILESREVQLAGIENQSLAAAFLAGIFETLWAA